MPYESFVAGTNHSWVFGSAQSSLLPARADLPSKAKNTVQGRPGELALKKKARTSTNRPHVFMVRSPSLNAVRRDRPPELARGFLGGLTKRDLSAVPAATLDPSLPAGHGGSTSVGLNRWSVRVSPRRPAPWGFDPAALPQPPRIVRDQPAFARAGPGPPGQPQSTT